MNIEGKKIVVTGGLGFIGSHIVELLLLENPKEIIVLDVIDSNSKHRLNHLRSNIIKYIHIDIRNVEYDNILPGSDLVIHCAADTNMKSLEKGTNVDLIVGLESSIKLLNAMVKNKVINLVYASSSAVYGELAFNEVNESNGPLLPISTYGASKLSVEVWINTYSKIYGIKGLIFRFGNIVGPKMNHGLIFDLLNKLKQNTTEISILGNGKQGRTYLHVKNCSEKVIQSIKKLFPSNGFDVYNLSGYGVLNTIDIIDILKEIFNLEKLTIIHANQSSGWIGDVSIVNIGCSKIEKMGIPIPSSTVEIKKAILDLSKEILNPLEFD